MFDDKGERWSERLDTLKKEVVIQELVHKVVWEGERGGDSGREELHVERERSEGN